MVGKVAVTAVVAVAVSVTRAGDGATTVIIDAGIIELVLLVVLVGVVGIGLLLVCCCWYCYCCYCYYWRGCY